MLTMYLSLNLANAKPLQGAGFLTEDNGLITSEENAVLDDGAQAVIIGHSSLRYAKAFVDETKIDLPVFVDGDDGYGDVKNVVHTVQSYERMGVSAFLIEDQQWPKRCGHMPGKEVISLEEMVMKVEAACLARRDEVLAQGFEARFLRLWEFYLAYCEAAFDEANIDVVQFTLAKPG